MRNFFRNNEHDVLLKDGCILTAENNTFYGAIIASIHFDEPARAGVTPGGGALLNNNIWWNVNTTFANLISQPPELDPIVIVNYSRIDVQHAGFGAMNISGDPLLKLDDLTLQQNSPATGAGFNGLDMGAAIPSGASISGEPQGVTTARDATLNIYGPGITHYRFKLDDEAFSGEFPTAQSIMLTNLSDGDHQVFVIGKNSAGAWQPAAFATASKIWTVNPAQFSLTISEVMYHPPNGSTFEFIEFYNPADTGTKIGGNFFSDGIQFTFPDDLVVPAKSFLILAGDDSPGFINFRAHYNLPESVTITGPFIGSLSNGGEKVELNSPGGEVLLSFAYNDSSGWPVSPDGAGHSLVPLDTENQPENWLDYPGNWRASVVINGSPGFADSQPKPTLILNEIMAHTDIDAPPYDSNDWIELLNATTSTLNTAGWYLSDDKDDLQKWALPPMNLAPGARISFDEMNGFHNPITIGFGINKPGEKILLSHLPGNANDRVADAVAFHGQEPQKFLEPLSRRWKFLGRYIAHTRPTQPATYKRHHDHRAAIQPRRSIRSA